MFENLVNEFDWKGLFLNRSTFFHRFRNYEKAFPETHRNFLQRTIDFSSKCKVLLITRNLLEVSLSGSFDNWDGYIFSMGEVAGRIFIAAFNKYLGANHDVSLS